MNSWPEKITRAVGSTTSLWVHTVLFVVSFALPFFGIPFERVLLVLTTIVSLEAIYLSLLIQMTVNRNTESLEEVEEEIEEIQEDIGEISEDLDEINEDIDEMQEDDTREEKHDKEVQDVLGNIKTDLTKLLADIERLKKG